MTWWGKIKSKTTDSGYLMDRLHILGEATTLVLEKL